MMLVSLFDCLNETRADEYTMDRKEFADNYIFLYEY